MNYYDKEGWENLVKRIEAETKNGSGKLSYFKKMQKEMVQFIEKDKDSENEEDREFAKRNMNSLARHYELKDKLRDIMIENSLSGQDVASIAKKVTSERIFKSVRTQTNEKSFTDADSKKLSKKNSVFSFFKVKKHPSPDKEDQQ